MKFGHDLHAYMFQKLFHCIINLVVVYFVTLSTPRFIVKFQHDLHV